MKKDNYNIFLVSEVLKGKQRPIHIFFEINYEMAKIYFQDYIKNTKYKWNYQLYKIAELDKNFKLTETKIFIEQGKDFEKINAKEHFINEKKVIEEALKANTTAEQIRIIFGGEYVK